CKKGCTDGFTVEYELCEGVKAPVSQGDEVGCAVLYKDGVELQRTKLIAMQTAERYTWWEALQEGANNWN
ncbi:MAG: hypothetical protein K2N74_00780, partial [Clostridiales bacterium]|nr:hypothetical protein [Clostridiales bacterium]